jgi:hypothetical protein
MLHEIIGIEKAISSEYSMNAVIFLTFAAED